MRNGAENTMAAQASVVAPGAPDVVDTQRQATVAAVAAMAMKNATTRS